MNYTITAEKRTKTDQPLNKLREAMRIPGVLYGAELPAESLSVQRGDFVKLLRSAGSSSLVDLELAGSSVKTLIKDFQVDPLSMEPIHVDFYRVRMDKKLEATVPLKFIGESKAVKTDGGTLVKSQDELEIRCLPGNLPHEIEVDLSKLENFEDAITIKSLSLPEGVEALQDPEATLATVARPLTEDQLAKLEESEVSDVSEVKTEAAIKAEVAAAEAEAAGEEAKK